MKTRKPLTLHWETLKTTSRRKRRWNWKMNKVVLNLTGPNLTVLTWKWSVSEVLLWLSQCSVVKDPSKIMLQKIYFFGPLPRSVTLYALFLISCVFQLANRCFAHLVEIIFFSILISFSFTTGKNNYFWGVMKSAVKLDIDSIDHWLPGKVQSADFIF